MTSSRERVDAALSHRETDRVPLDLGATSCSGIHVSSRLMMKVGSSNRCRSANVSQADWCLAATSSGPAGIFSPVALS